jgi:hypothetical protein
MSTGAETAGLGGLVSAGAVAETPAGVMAGLVARFFPATSGGVVVATTNRGSLDPDRGFSDGTASVAERESDPTVTSRPPGALTATGLAANVAAGRGDGALDGRMTNAAAMALARIPAATAHAAALPCRGFVVGVCGKGPRSRGDTTEGSAV